MSIKPPVQSGGRQCSDLPSAAAAATTKWCHVDSINSIARALPPEEGCSSGDCPLILHGKSQVRIERQGIGCADQADGVRVGRSGKERVECLQELVVRILIATCSVGAQTQPGFKRNPAYRLA